MLEQVTLPIIADHIATALSTAREDQDRFRRNERDWLEVNNPYFNALALLMFETRIRISGIETAEASLAGAMLGHHSIRLCTEAPSDLYVVGVENCRINLSSPRNLGVLPMIDEETLSKMFSDEQLIEVLLGISHPVARDATAAVIGFFSSNDFTLRRAAHTQR